MFNHNFYLNAHDPTIRDNLITRGSSMGIKTVANGTEVTQRLLIENNFLYDGEIGIDAGGNVQGPYRYTDVTVRNNVFSEIEKSNNDNRNFSWVLGLSDNDRTLVENNYFLHQPWFTSSYGISIGMSSNISMSTMRDVTVRANTFYNINGNAVRLTSQPDWSNIRVSDNRFMAPPSNACMINHTGSFGAVIYANNQYASEGAFCLGNQRQTLAQWRVSSSETNAQVFSGIFVDPNRTLATYATSQGYASINSFLAASQTLSRRNWRPALTANAVNNYRALL
jgi:Right handed beta helix region